MNDHESRISALEQARRELEDALIVMTHLETRQSNLLREQAEYLAGHEARLREQEKWNREQEKRNRDLDERIEKLVSGVGEWMRRTQ